MKKEFYNFHRIKFTADLKKIDHCEILNRAFNLNLFDIEKDEKDLLLNFIYSIKEKAKHIKSQIYQDVFADFFISNIHNETFLEFGATDGLDLSNTYLLENNSNWKGVLGEPDPQWHQKLIKNRPDSKIFTECVWKNSNEEVEFLSSDNGVLSTISSFRYSDKEMYDNTQLRNKSFKMIKLKTISLNDLIKREFNKICPSYISVDTEGSEFEILNNFDFKKYKPIILTVEHNYTSNEKKIDRLMLSNNYKRIFRKITAFDAWYVLIDALDLKLVN